MKICIDAGHGGNDTGAEGPTGLHESDVALSLAFKLANLLSDGDTETLLTRASDVFVELGDRCEIANDWAADYFICVHLNSNGSTAVGIETLYSSNNGLLMAEPIQEDLIQATGDVDRGVKHRGDLYVLNGTYMPAVLVEVGFISHPATEEKFKRDEYLDTIAWAIATGFNQFVEDQS